MIEQEAIRAVGMDNAGFMNFGKSRNDQVATAIRMEARRRLLDLAAALSSGCRPRSSGRSAGTGPR